jgi:hypothetical protein
VPSGTGPTRNHHHAISIPLLGTDLLSDPFPNCSAACAFFQITFTARSGSKPQHATIPTSGRNRTFAELAREM